MATQIVDNFQLNVAKPIDSRMVTSGTASRDNLQFTYEGLRVYDIVNKAPYVFINGAWQQESSSSIISNGGGGGGGSFGTGTVNRLLKYSGTGATNSAILDIGSFNSPNIGIGKTPGPGVALDVKGDGVFSSSVTATLFIGNLDGAYILPKSLLVDSILPGVDNQILKTVGSGNNAIVQWVDQANSNISILSETTETSTYYLLFSNLTGNVSTLNSNTKIGVKPSTSQILGSSDASTNSAGAPGYAFAANTTAGLYGNTTGIGLSFNSKALLKLSSSQLSILDTAGTTVLSSRTNGVLFGTDVHSYPERIWRNPETGEPELVPTPRKEYPLIISKTTSSATEPSYTWNGDAGTGMYSPASGEIGFSTANVNKLTLSSTQNIFTGYTRINGFTQVFGNFGVSDTAALGDLQVLRTFYFKPTNPDLPQPGPGKVLTSDANGYGTWKESPGVPYGTIIMWSQGSYIPTGWKKCMTYDLDKVSAGGIVAQILINGSYMNVPDMRDRNIMGSSDMNTISTGGNSSPKTAVTITAMQLPRHKHGISTGPYATSNNALDPNARATLTATSTFSDTTGHTHSYSITPQTGTGYDSGSQRQINHETTGVTSNTKVSGTVTTSVTLSGWTDDGTSYHGNIGLPLPLAKYYQMIFLIRYNPDATFGQDGHFKVETSESQSG